MGGLAFSAASRPHLTCKDLVPITLEIYERLASRKFVPLRRHQTNTARSKDTIINKPLLVAGGIDFGSFCATYRHA